MAKAKSPKKAPPAPAETPAEPASVLHLENLEIKDVEAAKQHLLVILARGTPVTLDVARVGVIDTAGVQLLAFHGEAAKRGIAVEFSGQSPPLRHALSVLGLQDRLQIGNHLD